LNIDLGLRDGFSSDLLENALLWGGFLGLFGFDGFSNGSSGLGFSIITPTFIGDLLLGFSLRSLGDSGESSEVVVVIVFFPIIILLLFGVLIGLGRTSGLERKSEKEGYKGRIRRGCLKDRQR